MTFWASALRYLIAAGIAGVATLFLGIPVPRQIFKADRFPFRTYAFEKEGKIYAKVLVHRWKDIVPDASKVISKMTKKRIKKDVDADAIKRLIQETCVAELVHWVLIVLTPVYSIGIDVKYGVLFSVFYTLGNLVFIIIQRYNRPRFVKMHTYMKMREMRKRG
ncbi:MAG: hypothetical protein IKJ65_07200 [Clostridia bacterium]|nr:hypothetical protein [Clostridia bacterium]